MRAIAVVPGARQVTIVDHRPPAIESPTQVRLRMLEAGVCGTDREICAFDYGTPPRGSEYLILGHESLGQVEEVGPEVTRVKPGDLVVTMVRRPCPHATCAACRGGRQDFCFTGDFSERGIKEAHGFMTEVVVDDERYMNVVPPELRDVAVLAEPLTIAEKALIQAWELQQRLPWTCPVSAGNQGAWCRRAVVIGAGPVGLLGAMALAANGFETWVYSREVPPTDKSRLVESFGARYLSSRQVAPAELAERVGGIDLVYEATGASRVAFDVMAALGTNGIFVFTGVPGRKSPVEVDTDLLMRNLVLKNQIVLGTVNAGRDAFEASIRDLGVFMQRWPDAVRALITGRFPMEAHRELLLGRAGGIKNVITLSRS